MRLVIVPPVLCMLVISTAALSAEDAPKHPLDPAIELVRATERHIVNDINDYVCKLAKIERIEGELREREDLQIKVRIPKQKNGAVVQKFSIFLEYVAPAKLQGRKVLFIEGENDGKMFV